MVSAPPSPMRSAASRRGSPGRNSHAPTERSVAASLATWPPDRLDRPVPAGVAEGAARRRGALAGAARHVGLEPVDAHLADVAAASPDRVSPGVADRRLLGGRQVGV